MAVTVARFPTPHEAHLARLRLEASGIEAFVVDEHVNSLMPLYGPAVGYVKLQVAGDDAEAAREALSAEPGAAARALDGLGTEGADGAEIVITRPPPVAPRPDARRWALVLALAAVAALMLARASG
jgi:hypothetical protein